MAQLGKRQELPKEPKRKRGKRGTGKSRRKPNRT